MIMSMFKVCITNRKLVEGDFLSQIKKVLLMEPDLLVLREKDLNEKEYEALACEVKKLCENSSTTLVLHSFSAVARRLDIHWLHMPLAAMKSMTTEEKAYFRALGVSVHSAEEAVLAESCGASYVTAGHVFSTDCKKGVPGRGLSFLKEVCESVSIPVYAIGGIHEDNIKDCISQGAAGVCMMSEYMKLRTTKAKLEALGIVTEELTLD